MQHCLEPLDAAGIVVSVFSDTVRDSDRHGDRGRRRASCSRGDFDCLIGFGGGSPIDTAKAMAILAAGGGKMRDYKVPFAADRGALPVIAIPTTPAPAAMHALHRRTDTERDEKMLIAGSARCRSPRSSTTSYTAYPANHRRYRRRQPDACLEAFVSKRANPFSDALAVSAMALIGPTSARLCRAEQCRGARRDDVGAARRAGVLQCSVALVHGMSRPIGAHFHVPHGLSNAMLLRR